MGAAARCSQKRKHKRMLCLRPLLLGRCSQWQKCKQPRHLRCKQPLQKLAPPSLVSFIAKVEEGPKGERVYRYTLTPGADIEGCFRNVRRRIEVELEDGLTVQMCLQKRPRLASSALGLIRRLAGSPSMSIGMVRQTKLQS